MGIPLFSSFSTVLPPNSPSCATGGTEDTSGYAPNAPHNQGNNSNNANTWTQNRRVMNSASSWHSGGVNVVLETVPFISLTKQLTPEPEQELSTAENHSLEFGVL